MTKKRSAQKSSLRQQQKQADARRQRLIIGSLAAVAILALVALVLYRTSTAPSVDAVEEIASANIDGPNDAPVQVVEFGDFGCPACRQWHNLGIKQQLKAEFGDQISFTFRHFPVITRQSPRAAEAGQCAAEQDAFWQYHDYIYEQTPQSALSDANLKQYAAVIGLDTAQFNSCLDSGAQEEYVSRDWQSATSSGARGTPTFFINGRQVSPDYETMAAVINQLLAQAGS